MTSEETAMWWAEYRAKNPDRFYGDTDEQRAYDAALKAVAK